MATSQPRDNYHALHSQFRWLVPDEFNIAEVCSRRWAQAPSLSRHLPMTH